ncbi:MAG: hypothetical protein L6Q76_05050 [Polyangiaceae bacterium]|nr:hypothetical protein [Polyangiaceae bacterium]
MKRKRLKIRRRTAYFLGFSAGSSGAIAGSRRSLGGSGSRRILLSCSSNRWALDSNQSAALPQRLELSEARGLATYRLSYPLSGVPAEFLRIIISRSHTLPEKALRLQKSRRCEDINAPFAAGSLIWVAQSTSGRMLSDHEGAAPFVFF